MSGRVVFDEKTCRLALLNLGEILKQKSQTDMLSNPFPTADFAHMFGGAKTDERLHFLNFSFITSDKQKLDTIAAELQQYIRQLLKTKGQLSLKSETYTVKGSQSP